MDRSRFAALCGVSAFIIACCAAPPKGVFGGAAVAQASLEAEAELEGLRDLCWNGSRRACIRFGILIGRNQQRHADWRRMHPGWWEWERW
jgi:hypothetical protein